MPAVSITVTAHSSSTSSLQPLSISAVPPPPRHRDGLTGSRRLRTYSLRVCALFASPSFPSPSLPRSYLLSQRRLTLRACGRFLPHSQEYAAKSIKSHAHSSRPVSRFIFQGSASRRLHTGHLSPLMENNIETHVLEAFLVPCLRARFVHLLFKPYCSYCIMYLYL